MNTKHAEPFTQRTESIPQEPCTEPPAGGPPRNPPRPTGGGGVAEVGKAAPHPSSWALGGRGGNVEPCEGPPNTAFQPWKGRHWLEGVAGGREASSWRCSQSPWRSPSLRSRAGQEARRQNHPARDQRSKAGRSRAHGQH